MRSAVLLAGGRGARLGEVSKPLLQIGEARIVDRILDALAPLVSESIAVVNDDTLVGIAGLTLVRDEQPHSGVLPALWSGLTAARGEYCLVVAADMPFVNRALFNYLCDLASGWDLVVPRVDGRIEPMHAVYRRESCIVAVAESKTRGERRMTEVHPRVRVRYVDEPALLAIDPQLRAFTNINTEADLERARRMAEAD